MLLFSARKVGPKFAFELSADGQSCHLAEEIIGVVDLSVVGLLEVIEVLGSHLEHLSCSLAVGSRDERRVEVEIAVLVEIGVDRHSHVMTDAENGSKSVGTRTEMCDCAQELHAQSFFLQRVFLGIGGTIYLQIG